MDENKTILPPAVLVSLFKDSLVLPENKINPAIIEQQNANLAADQEAFAKKNNKKEPIIESKETEVTAVPSAPPKNPLAKSWPKLPTSITLRQRLLPRHQLFCQSRHQCPNQLDR